MEYQFYSIVIPAHNEENYIAKTLKHMISLNYPKEKYEIIIVENGSTDKTLLEIKKIKSKFVKVYQIKKRGLSIAKNFGAKKSSKKSKWLIFVDADSIANRNFLTDINFYLTTNSKKNLSVGNVKVLSKEKNFKGRFWFRAVNLLQRLFKYTGGVQIVNKDFFKKIKYDRNLKVAEDMHLIKRLKKEGEFFYIDTEVLTSSRRVIKRGVLKLTLEYLYIGILPHKIRIKQDYRVIR